MLTKLVIFSPITIQNNAAKLLSLSADIVAAAGTEEDGLEEPEDQLAQRTGLRVLEDLHPLEGVVEVYVDRYLAL